MEVSCKVKCQQVPALLGKEIGRGKNSITARGKCRRTGTYYNKNSCGEPDHNGVERWGEKNYDKIKIFMLLSKPLLARTVFTQRTLLALFLKSQCPIR